MAGPLEPATGRAIVALAISVTVGFVVVLALAIVDSSSPSAGAASRWSSPAAVRLKFAEPFAYEVAGPLARHQRPDPAFPPAERRVAGEFLLNLLPLPRPS